MSRRFVLAVVAGPTGVTAQLLDDGRERALAHSPVEAQQDGDRFLLAAEDAWTATLAAAREAIATGGPTPATVRIGPRLDSLVLWDRETLGAPGPVVVSGAGDRGFLAAALADLRRATPRTWALVEEGRYAVGPLESYLVARMTRGVWHAAAPLWTRRSDLSTADGRWSAPACAEAAIPVGALPEVLDHWQGVTTDPGSFLGLEVPLAG